MSTDFTNPFFQQHYQVPPENKSVNHCYQHGGDHATYGWAPKLDPRWSDDQRQAYIKGYEEGVEIRKR